MLHQGGSVRWLPERIRNARRAAFVALFAAVATAGIASATIPTDGVISACYSKSGGTLRVIDSTVTKCGKSETSLAWNVQGPAGPQGEQGPEGPAGPAGQNGVSAGFGVALGPELDIDSANIAGIVVVSKTMPAGNYVLTARVSVVVTAGSPGACWIPGDRATFVGSDGTATVQHITVTSGVAHPGGAIELRCAKSSSSSSSYLIRDASLTGVRVDTLD